MFFLDGAFVYDSQDWYSCDYHLCEVFGVHFVSKDIFKSSIQIRYGVTEYRLTRGRLNLLIFGSVRTIRLSDLCREVPPSSVKAKNGGTVILDDNLLSVAPTFTDEDSIDVNVVEVTKDSILRDIYGYKGNIIDKPERQSYYELESFIQNGRNPRGQVHLDFDLFWKRNGADWLIFIRKIGINLNRAGSTGISRGLVNYLIHCSDSELVEKIRSDSYLSVRLYSKRVYRYFVALGPWNEYLTEWANTVRNALSDSLERGSR